MQMDREPVSLAEAVADGSRTRGAVETGRPRTAAVPIGHTTDTSNRPPTPPAIQMGLRHSKCGTRIKIFASVEKSNSPRAQIRVDAGSRHWISLALDFVGAGFRRRGRVEKCFVSQRSRNHQHQGGRGRAIVEGVFLRRVSTQGGIRSAHKVSDAPRLSTPPGGASPCRNCLRGANRPAERRQDPASPLRIPISLAKSPVRSDGPDAAPSGCDVCRRRCTPTTEHVRRAGMETANRRRNHHPFASAAELQRRRRFGVCEVMPRATETVPAAWVAAAAGLDAS